MTRFVRIEFEVAEGSGDYQLEVRAQNKKVPGAKYDIRIEELREATSKDRVEVAAQRAFEEANQLRDQRTAESRLKAIRKYEEALPLWRHAGGKRGEAYTLNELGFVNSSLGDVEKALGYYIQALSLWRDVGDHINEANSLNNIGLVHYHRPKDERRWLRLRSCGSASCTQ